MTPIEQALTALEAENQADSLPTLERAGARLQSHPKLRQALSALMGYHSGYAAECRLTGELVVKLLNETFAATNGELRWASELPRGRAPAFRRALNNLVVHFKKNRS